MSTTLPSAIERTLNVPWVVLGTYERMNGSVDSVTDIVEAPLNRPPAVEDTLGAFQARRVIKASVFPATRFLDVEPKDRRAFAGAFRYYQLWSRARAVGKLLHQIVPIQDYDPLYMEAEYLAWINGMHPPPTTQGA